MWNPNQLRSKAANINTYDCAGNVWSKVANIGAIDSSGGLTYSDTTWPTYCMVLLTLAKKSQLY